MSSSATPTRELFDELSNELPLRAPPEGVASATARQQSVRAALLLQDDLAQALLEVLLGDAACPVEPTTVLAWHRRTVRRRCAAGLLADMDPVRALAVVLTASHGDENVRHETKKSAYAIVQRAPALWAAVLEPTTGIDTLRYCLARIRVGEPLEGRLAPITRLGERGLAADLVYPLLAAEPTGVGRRTVVAAALEGSLPSEARALALGALRGGADATDTARALVRARSHATSRPLVLEVLRALEAGGMDAALEHGHGLATHSVDELGEALVAWLEADPDARGRDVDVGLVPMHRGFYGERDGRLGLARARDQTFVVGGLPLWRVRYTSWDERDDPNRVERLAALPEGARVDASRIRPGPYLRGVVAVPIRSVPASHGHPFPREPLPVADDDDDDDDADERAPPPLPVRWWCALAPAAPADAWSVEVALLPAHDGTPGTVRGRAVAYAWFMPTWFDRVPSPTRVQIYGVVLQGEQALDAAAGSEDRAELELIFPLVGRADRLVYAAVLEALGAR